MRFITLTVVITLAGVNAQGQWGVNQWHQNPNQQWNQNPNQWNTVQPTRQPPAGQPARQPAGQWPAAQPTAQPAAQPARQPARQPMYTNQQQWRGQPMYTNQQQWGAQPNQYNQQQQRPGVHKVANLRPRKRAMMQCFKCTPLPFNLCDPDFVLQVVILREVILDKSNGFDVFNGHKVYQARLQEPYLKATPALDGLLSTYGGPTHDILMLWVKHVDKTCPSPIITPGPMVISGNLVEYQHTVPSSPSAGVELRATIDPCSFYGKVNFIHSDLMSFLRKDACGVAQVIMPSQFGTTFIDQTTYNPNLVP